MIWILKLVDTALFKEEIVISHSKSYRKKVICSSIFAILTFGFILKEKFGLFLQHNTQIKILDQLLDRVLDLIKKMEPSVKLTGLYFFLLNGMDIKLIKL